VRKKKREERKESSLENKELLSERKLGVYGNWVVSDYTLLYSLLLN
jgi:hypothetical protein